MNEMKYSNVTWNKKGTLRTYSKSRPRYVNCKDPPNQDDVFGTAPLSDVVTKGQNGPSSYSTKESELHDVLIQFIEFFDFEQQ